MKPSSSEAAHAMALSIDSSPCVIFAIIFVFVACAYICMAIAVNPGNGQVTLTWTAPTSNGSANVSGYIVTPYVGTSSMGAHVFNSTLRSQDITGLADGTAYTFKVAAKNARGTGPPSAASNAVTPS